MSASDAAQLAAWYARYALDRLGDDPRRFRQGASSRLAAACLEHEAAAKAFWLEHGQVIEDGHGDAAPLGRLLSVSVGVEWKGRAVDTSIWNDPVEGNTS